MIEYGIKIDTRQDGGPDKKVLVVYFTPMTYYDWIYFSTPESTFEPAHIRGIIQSYVTRIVYDGPEIDYEYTIYHLMDEDENVLIKLVNKMLEKAGFDNEETLLNTVKRCREKSKTLAGAYDTFIMANTDINFYTQFLNSDIYTRAQIISTIEKIKHFTVEDRYMDAIKENIEINLIASPDEYEKWKFDTQKKRAMAEENRNKRPTKPNVKKEVLSEDLHDIITQSQKALNEAMRVTKISPSKTFNWEEDEKDFGDQ